VFWHPRHMRRDGPLTRRSRVASRYVRRDLCAADGTEVSVWAFPRGIRPTAAWSVSVAPNSLWVIRVVFENVRYRTKYRGAWVVEVRNPDSDLPIDERIVPSRRAAMDTVEQARTRLAGLSLDHIGMALRP
jgi:hypothetical protein